MNLWLLVGWGGGDGIPGIWEGHGSPTRTYHIAQGTLLIVMCQPGREGDWGENGYRYLYG